MDQASHSKRLPAIGALSIVAVILSLFAGWALLRGTAVAAPPAAADLPVEKAGPAVVYEANFDKGVGPEWSAWNSPRTAVTRDGKKPYLGPFRDDSIEFAIKALPPHKFIRLQFELITTDRWDGDSSNFGRDLWDLRVVNGQPLIHTTFSNCGFFDNNNEQSFPDQYPWYPTHPGWTGAAAKQSLGWKTSQGSDSWGCDSTYAFDLTFPHSVDTLSLVFKSQIKKHENKPYGFLSFKVSAVDQAATADDKTLAGWWKDLSDEDPVKAYHAVWALVATGDTATAYIRDHLPAEATGPNAAPLNIDQEALWHHSSFQYDTPAARQRARAIHVLEVIDSPTASAFLEQIGYQGTPAGAPPDPWDNGN